MPKQKTRKAVAKRFKKTGTGKILRAQAGRKHLAQHKSRKRKRQLGLTVGLPKAFAQKITNSLSPKA